MSLQRVLYCWMGNGQRHLMWSRGQLRDVAYDFRVYQWVVEGGRGS